MAAPQPAPLSWLFRFSRPSNPQSWCSSDAFEGACACVVLSAALLLAVSGRVGGRSPGCRCWTRVAQRRAHGPERNKMLYVCFPFHVSFFLLDCELFEGSGHVWVFIYPYSLHLTQDLLISRRFLYMADCAVSSPMVCPTPWGQLYSWARFSQLQQCWHLGPDASLLRRLSCAL